MLGFVLIAILLALNTNVSGQPDVEKDSLESLLPFANDLQRADILNGLAICVRNIDTAKAGNYARQSLAISNKLNYCKGKAMAEITLGILAKNGSYFNDSKQHFLTGLSLALKCKDPMAVSYAYHSLGNSAYHDGDLSRAMRYYIASVKISEQIGDKVRAARTYNNIGSLYMDLNNFARAEEYYLHSLELYKGYKDELVVAEIENNLANIYQVGGFQLKALYHYTNALDVFRKRSNSHDVSSALHNIGLVYLHRKQPKKALPFLSESYSIDYQNKDSRALILVLTSLTRAYTQLDMLDSAITFVNIGVEVAKQNPNLAECADLYDAAASIYERLNDNKKRDYFLNLKKNNEAMAISKADRSEINSTAIEYEIERKENKVKLLQKENEINQLRIRDQQLEIERRNILILAISVVLLFLVLIVGLIVYLLSINKKHKLAEMSNLSKSSILQQLNHEIRTPLNGIVGMSQLAFESKTFSELKDNLSYIRQSSDDLMFVLNNLISFLQIDRKEANPVASPFNLLQSLEELFKVYGTKCQASGLLFNQMVFPGVPQVVSGDKQKIMIMLQNLLSNASKHGKKGVVKIEVKESASRMKDNIRYSTIQFSVIDEGEGFTEKEIKKLFRKDESKNNFGTGLGIGLSNVKDLCDLMKGHLQVISEKGVGSSFILELELEDLSEKAADFTTKKLKNRIFEPKKFHILVVEDNPINQLVFEKILEREGFNVNIVSNGLEALASLKVKSPDLILMDLRMPEMGGIEAAMHIRTRSEFGKDRYVPIIAVTAHDDSEEKKKCFEVGMNDYLTKPINKELFLNAIESQIMGKN